jgi:hypothetical protein
MKKRGEELEKGGKKKGEFLFKISAKGGPMKRQKKPTSMFGLS